ESLLAVAAWLAAVRLRRSARRGAGWRARSPAASAAITRRTNIFFPSGAADRRAFVLAAGEAGTARARRRVRPAHRHPFGLWAGAHFARVLADHRPRHRRDVGLSAVAVLGP